jgi:hypothetical protein
MNGKKKKHEKVSKSEGATRRKIKKTSNFQLFPCSLTFDV